MLKENTRYEILTPTGFKYFKGIRKLRKNTIKIICNDIYCIVSKDHIFIVDNKNIKSCDLKIGDRLQHKIKGYIYITDIIYYKYSSVYDPIDVIGNEYYSNNIISHNCEFLGSANTIIEKDTLVKLENQKFPDPMYGLNDKLKIFEKPIQGFTYILGGDPSKGTGEHDAAIQVLKIISIAPFKTKQVAVFKDNKTDTHTFAYILNNLSIQYNNGFIMLENNGEGSAVIQTLWWEIECENLVCEGTKSTKLGIRSTSKTKPIAVLNMKKLIEDGCVEINDPDTVKQLTAFIDKGNNRFAGNNYPDDLVDALYWALYFIKFDLLDESMEYKRTQEEDDDIWGFLNDADDIEEGYEILQRY